VEEPADGMHITAAALAAPLRCLLGSNQVTAATWQVAPLQNSLGGATGGIFRVEGSAHDGGGSIPFALVLKVIQAPTGDPAGTPPVNADPADGFYWKREVLAYQSGLLADLPGVVAPQCYGVEKQADGTVWLWLEAVQDDGGPAWPLDSYGTAARHLGQFNGAYLAGRPRPGYSWLSRHWLRDWVARTGGYRDRSLIQQVEAWRAPLARIAFSEPVAEQTCACGMTQQPSWRRSTGYRQRCCTATPTAPTCSVAATPAGRMRPLPSIGPLLVPGRSGRRWCRSSSPH